MEYQAGVVTAGELHRIYNAKFLIAGFLWIIISQGVFLMAGLLGSLCILVFLQTTGQRSHFCFISLLVSKSLGKSLEAYLDIPILRKTNVLRFTGLTFFWEADSNGYRTSTVSSLRTMSPFNKNGWEMGRISLDLQSQNSNSFLLIPQEQEIPLWVVKRMPWQRHK